MNLSADGAIWVLKEAGISVGPEMTRILEALAFRDRLAEDIRKARTTWPTVKGDLRC